MKKLLKKSLALMLSALVSVPIVNPTPGALAAMGNTDSTQNIAIVLTYNYLGDESSYLICHGETATQYGYTAKVKVELQRYNGGWSTIKTWTDTHSNFADVYEEPSPAKGYSYRLKLTHQAYKGSTLVETINSTSNTVYYK